MLQLLQESISPLNLPFTILLGGVALYWIIGLVGLVDLEGGIDGLDGIDGVDGVDGIDGVDGVEVDGIGGGDHNLTGDSGGVSIAGAFFNGLLKMVGASDAPLIFVISLFSVFLWAFNMAGNHYFNLDASTAKATLLLIPVIIIASIFTRVLIRPLRPFMKLIKTTDDEPLVIVGASGRVRSATLDSDFGQIEVDVNERSLILNARIFTGEPLSKGAQVLVISYDKDSEIYSVRALD